MALTIPGVGVTSGYAAPPMGAGGVVPLPAGVTPSWTVSDTTIATAVVDTTTDPSGLTVKLTGVKAGSVTLAVSAKVPSSTDPSGFITATGSLSVVIAAADVLSFSIAQVS